MPKRSAEAQVEEIEKKLSKAKKDKKVKGNNDKPNSTPQVEKKSWPEVPAPLRTGYTALADRLNPKRAGFDPIFKVR
jgi:hypothetical protein